MNKILDDKYWLFNIIAFLVDAIDLVVNINHVEYYSEKILDTIQDTNLLIYSRKYLPKLGPVMNKCINK